MTGRCDHCGECGAATAHAEECMAVQRVEIARLRALAIEACDLAESALRNAPGWWRVAASGDALAAGYAEVERLRSLVQR